MKHFLQGLIAAPHTPFERSGDIAFTTIPRQVALLTHNQVNGAFICGTTGEGSSLTVAERKLVAEAWRAATPKQLRLIVHVGHSSLRESCELAKHAQAIGADAIATISPSYFKPAGVAELVAWCEQVANTAPDLPFYYYHMPSITGVHIPVPNLLEAARDRIPNLAGVKFTYEDMEEFRASSEACGGKFGMLFGRDEILLDGLKLQAEGAVGSTYNFAAPLYHRLISAFEGGDLEGARQCQLQAQQFIDVLTKYGGLAAGKATMKLIGIDCGGVRLPLRSLDEAGEQAMRAELEKVGFFDYCCQLPS